MGGSDLSCIQRREQTQCYTCYTLYTCYSLLHLLQPATPATACIQRQEQPEAPGQVRSRSPSISQCNLCIISVTFGGKVSPIICRFKLHSAC